MDRHVNTQAFYDGLWRGWFLGFYLLSVPAALLFLIIGVVTGQAWCFGLAALYGCGWLLLVYREVA